MQAPEPWPWTMGQGHLGAHRLQIPAFWPVDNSTNANDKSHRTVAWAGPRIGRRAIPVKPRFDVATNVPGAPP